MIYRTQILLTTPSCVIYNISNVRVAYYIYSSATTLTKFTFPMSLTLTAGTPYYIGYASLTALSGLCGGSRTGVASTCRYQMIKFPITFTFFCSNTGAS